ncbi:MAG: ATP-dependent sacrificial sulfur transferase LarE [Candidatus Bathyarchaeia archaeon]
MLTAKGPDGSEQIDGLLPEMSPVLRAKMEETVKMLRGFSKILVAFSGGIDSTLVAYLAKLAVGDNAIAVTANSPSLPTTEMQEARRLAKEIGINHMVIRTEELDDPRYVSNPANRCYFCKKELSGKLKQLAADLGATTLVDGTNADDMFGHRPGAAALAEEGVRRPLSEVGMTKPEVRELSRVLGLPNFDKPSMPCLSSRIQYGQTISPERLMRVEKSESFIRSVTNVKELRVRDHGDVARIEVGKDERNLFFNGELLDRIGKALREFGFKYVSFDLFGYRAGSMNETLIPQIEPKSK